MARQSFHPLRISRIAKLTPECVSVQFEIPESLRKEYAFHPGQHLTLMTTLEGEEIRRPYSLSTAPYEERWEVAIKEVKNGKFSTFANNQLEEGDVLHVMTPEGNFRVHEDKGKDHIVAFAAGSGITPVISMIKSVLKEGTKSVTLFYGNRNTESIIYREELEALKSKYLDRFSIHYILSREKLGSPMFYGRIDRDKCEMYLKYLIDPSEISQFLLCGPGDMIFEIKKSLEENGVEAGLIHYELFTTADMKTEMLEGQKSEEVSLDGLSNVRIRIDGLISIHQIPYNGKSILDIAMNNGADIPYSCKGGVCSTCKAKLISGEVSLDINYALEAEELAAGFILTCQAHPRSETIEIDFDEK